MRLTIIFLTAVTASASWFASDTPQYTTWSVPQLKSWLVAHNIPIPADSNDPKTLLETVQVNWDTVSLWSQDQYNTAQHSFSDLRETTFETWDESRLREWLLEQGIVAPKSKKEELLVLAKHRYNDYLAAVNRWGSQASESAGDFASSAHNLAATAAEQTQTMIDNSKDYVYSTWDDNRLRTYLVEQRLLKSAETKTRDDLLAMMQNAYTKSTDHVWNAWSTGYMHRWLLSHNLIPDSQLTSAEKVDKSRSILAEKMNMYYYTASQNVWDTWTDSQLHSWLVENNIIKENAQITRSKMLKMVSETYSSAASTILTAWSDSQIRSWLVTNGYVDDRTASQKKRNELVQIIKEKYDSTSTAITSAFSPHQAPYLSWPDNRLRAYLIERGVKENNLPLKREGLVQSARELFTHPDARPAETTLERIREIVDNGVVRVEDQLKSIWDILTGYGVEKWDQGNVKMQQEKMKVEKVSGKSQTEL